MIYHRKKYPGGPKKWLPSGSEDTHILLERGVVSVMLNDHRQCLSASIYKESALGLSTDQIEYSKGFLTILSLMVLFCNGLFQPSLS